MGAGAALIGSSAIGAIGSGLSAKASQPKAIAAPKPQSLFPGMQDSYMNSLKDSGITGSSFATINEATRTGLPTDVGPAFDALKASSARGIEEGRTNLIEKFGVQGLRHGSDLRNAGVDFESQVQKDFSSILADYTRQASESAASRRLGAAGMGAGLAGEPGLAMTPSAVLSSGGSSATGAALQSAAGSTNNIMLMKALFPDLFK